MLSKDYIAGLFDGEGYVTIHGRSDNYIMCYIGIVMQDTTVLDLLQQQFPMSKLYGHDKNNKLSRRQCTDWRLTSLNAKEFVDLIYSTSLLKKEDLDWYYAWYDLSRNTTNKLSEATINKRQQFLIDYKEWRALRKG